MKTRSFKIRIRPSNESLSSSLKESFKKAEAGPKADQHDLVLTFPDLSWLNRIFSPERMRLLQTIRYEKPGSIYELAKIVGRKISNVQRDVYELAEFGIIELKKEQKADSSRIVRRPWFPWSGFDIAV